MASRQYDEKDSTSYKFQIHTDSYAGNFERELCAYATGMVGDCRVGDDSAKQFYADMKLMDHLLEAAREDKNDPWDGCDVQTMCEDLDNPFVGYIESVPDDHGCFRPASLAVVNGEPNTVEIYFEKEPTEELIELMMERCRKWVTDPDVRGERSKILHRRNEPSRILGFSLLARKVTIEPVRNWPG